MKALFLATLRSNDVKLRMIEKRVARAVLVATSAFVLLASVAGAQAPRRFGGEYDALASGQQRLIADWVSRFNEVTGVESEPGAFYDELLKLSTKTTFDAVTHALIGDNAHRRSRPIARDGSRPGRKPRDGPRQG